jgi:hypothetical protein
MCCSDIVFGTIYTTCAGLMGSVVTGMAMGTGSAVAHRAVDSMMGPRQVEHVHANAPAAAPGQSSRCSLETLNRVSNRRIYVFVLAAAKRMSKLALVCGEAEC